MNTQLKTIQIKKKQLDQYKPYPKTFRSNMEEWYKIELTYTSNAIEGNTLTRQETALVVEKGITVEGKSITEHLEAINHAHAFEYIQSLPLKSTYEISEKIVRDIHAIILRNIDTMNAGIYRNVPVRIAGSSVVLPNLFKVPELMETFMKELRNSKSGAVETALDAHFRLVSIHPFADGNGRTARLLMNLILMVGGYPPAIIRKEDRSRYINSIEKGQLTGNMSEYNSFMLKAVERSLNTYLETLSPKDTGEKVKSNLFKIGQLAQATHETVATIRFWTKESLLKVAEYSPGGYQLYTKETVDRIKKLRTLQKEKRLTIEELKKIK